MKSKKQSIEFIQLLMHLSLVLSIQLLIWAYLKYQYSATDGLNPVEAYGKINWEEVIIYGSVGLILLLIFLWSFRKVLRQHKNKSL